MPIRRRLNKAVADIASNDADILALQTSVAALGVPLQFKGTIAANSDFPTAALVQSGWTYRVTADVTDDDATKTNTGDSFLALSEIAWNGTDWTVLGTEVTATYVGTTPATLTVGDVLVEVDTVTIGGASVVNLPALTATQVGKVIIVTDVSGGAGTDRISVTPNGADEINGVAAAVDIDQNYGSMTVTAVQTGAATYGWLAKQTSQSLKAQDDISTIQARLVQAVITATGGTGGATAGTVSVQVNDLDGNPVSSAVDLELNTSLTQYAGIHAATGTALFGAATTGTLNAGNGTVYAHITTNAAGLYEGAINDAADETVYVAAKSASGGHSALANGCVVVAVVPDAATWSA